MKKLFLFCVFLAFAFVANGTVALSGADIQIKPGESKQLEISLTNDVEFSGFQLDLVLPTGITVTGKSKKQKAQLTGILEELDYDYTVGPTAEGYFGIRVFSTEEGMTIEPSDGVVITVNIQAAEDMALGEREIKLTNIIISQDGNAVDLDDVIFKAQVVKTVTFSVSSADPTKGTVTDNSGTYNSGTSLTATAVPLDGYEFVNWTSGEEEVSKENPYVFTVTEDVSLTANFQATTFTISYELDGGQLAEGDTNPGEYTIESVAIELKNPTKTGYTFAGWLKDGEETPSTKATIATGTTGNLKFTAQWTINQYTITFDTDGGSEVASITAAYESTVTKPADPTKEGYDFAGWDPEFPETMPLNGATLKAKWTPKQYTITFDTDGGSEVASITAAYGSTLTKPADPTKEGYDFAGWDPEFPETMPLNGATLKAKWTETSSIKALFRDSKAVNVYTVGGTLVGRDMTVGEVLQLKRGIYVINGKKIVVK